MKKTSIVAVILFLLVFLFWQAIYLPKDLGSPEEVLFIIKRGARGGEIASQLEKEGLIKSAFLFQSYAFLKGSSKKLQAGAYLLSPSMTLPKILKKIAAGDVVKIKVTIPEGFRIEQVEERINDAVAVTLNEVKGLVGSAQTTRSFASLRMTTFQSDFEFLQDAPGKATLEGYLFPDTYQFSFAEAIEEEVIKKMLDNFGEKLTADLREEIKNQGKTIFVIVTMASLLEKEVELFEDRQLVAGILWKRRQNKIPLQVDATIAYITGKATSRISREETEIDSPYNTYKYLDLPRGPIGNPGLDSIRAAVYPEDSDYWYYLSATDGTTIFSRTLEEHNVAKVKYLQ